MRAATAARALAVVVTVAGAGCAASRSGPSPAQSNYIKAHALSEPERLRLAAREARRGDTLERVRITFDDCDWEQQRVDGAEGMWRVHVPIDARPIRVVTDKLEEIAPGGSALLTFERDLLKSVLIFE
jgi:hypothetical protein